MSRLAAFVYARLDEAEAAAKALRDEDWDDRPWDVTECSDKSSAECPCIVYQGAYAPLPEAQVPHIRYIADAETPEIAAWIARHDPARALRKLAVRRRILARHGNCGTGTGYCDDGGHGLEADDGTPSGCADLYDLAGIWDDHPDYDPEWKPAVM